MENLPSADRLRERPLPRAIGLVARISKRETSMTAMTGETDWLAARIKPRAGWRSTARRLAALLVGSCLGLLFVCPARASDHLDSPATVANPQADVSDVYAWTAPYARQLNLVMTIQGHSFSDKIRYAIHVDSGKTFGQTSASTTIECRFDSANAILCELGKADTASGDASDPAGLESRNHHFRVYAGLRDDPFYNNIKGLLAAYGTAARATESESTSIDLAGCPHFDASTTREILDQMSHTDGGPAQNLLRDWTVSAIVISVDLNLVSRGGPLLAVWGTTSSGGKLLDRMARPFVANTLLGVAPFSSDEASGDRRQEFNQASSVSAARFVADLQKSLAFQDSLDGRCGNQLLAAAKESNARYRALARVFADDRLWVDSSARVCTQFFAVELASLTGATAWIGDCGGRTPIYDTSNVWRSLLIAGTLSGVSDGLQQDEHAASAETFPFLAPPDPRGVDH